MRWTRSLGLCVALLMIMTLVAACGGDDDDDSTPEITPNTGTVATDSGASAATGTPSANQPGTPAATADAPENTPADTDVEVEDSTATTGMGAEATTTTGTGAEATTGTGSGGTDATATSGDDASATVSGTGGNDVPEECESAIEDVETLDPDLIPNFSVRFEIATGGDSGEESELGTISILMNQSEPGTYYTSMDAEGIALESWVIGDQAWNDFGTGVTESTPGAEIFTPDTLLSQMTDGLRDFYEADEQGSEEINGRDTTIYVVTGEDFADSYNRCAGDAETIDEASGELSYWIDDEWGIMIKGEGSMEWTYSDGTVTTFDFNQEIFDIGSTADIEPPV